MEHLPDIVLENPFIRKFGVDIMQDENKKRDNKLTLSFFQNEMLEIKKNIKIERSTITPTY